MREFTDYESMVMLELSETERMKLKETFEKITDGFSAINAYDTSGVEPLVTVLDVTNIMREDIPAKLITREELLKNAPVQHDGYFQVPATID